MIYFDSDKQQDLDLPSLKIENVDQQTVHHVQVASKSKNEDPAWNLMP